MLDFNDESTWSSDKFCRGFTGQDNFEVDWFFLISFWMALVLVGFFFFF